MSRDGHRKDVNLLVADCCCPGVGHRDDLFLQDYGPAILDDCQGAPEDVLKSDLRPR